MWTLLWPVQPLKKKFFSTDAMKIDVFLTYVPDFVKGSAHTLDSGQSVVLDGAGSNLFHIIVPSEFDDITIHAGLVGPDNTLAIGPGTSGHPAALTVENFASFTIKSGGSGVVNSGGTFTVNSGGTISSAAGSTANLARWCSPPVTDSYSATVALNFASGNNHVCTLTGDVNLSASNIVDGSLCTVTIVQGAGGSHVVSWSGTFVFGAVDNVASTGVGDITIWLFLSRAGFLSALLKAVYV